MRNAMAHTKNVFVFILCIVTLTRLSAQQTTTIRIDPTQARGATASEVFSTIKFVPLETTKESIFGTIHQLEVFDSMYFILDKVSRAIFIFTYDGTYKSKIQAGGSDKFFDYFTINKHSKQICVLNDFVNGVLIYDFNGNLIKTMPHPERPSSIFYLGKNSYLYYNRRRIAYTDTLSIRYDLSFSDSLGVVRKKRHPYNAQFENGEFNIENNFLTHSGEDGSAFFSMPFEYSLFQVNDTGVIHNYKFIFPATNSLPQGFVTDSIFKGKRARSVYGNEDAAHKVNSIQTAYKIRNYLLFAAPMGRSNVGNNYNYLYNVINGRLLSFSKVTGDSSSSYLPIMSSVFEKILFAKNGTVYSSLPAFRIFSIKETLEKNIVYPNSIEKLLASGSKNHNPVLVVVELKKNL